MNVFDKAHEKAIKSYINRIKAIMDKYTEEYCKVAPTGAFDPSKPFSFEDYPATFSKVKSLEAKLAKEMRVTVEDGIRDSWAMSNDKNDQLVRSTLSVEALDGMSEAAVRRYFNQNSGLLDAFMTRRVGGMNLSQRVWRITEQNQQEMENAIDIALRDGTDAGTLSRKVRRLLNEPDRLFRRVRDEHGVLHLSKAAKAFHPGRGVYRSSYKNAMRLAGTEINIAYRTADYARYQQLDFIVGVEVVTSPTNHPEPDICDELKGRYPKDFKFTGWHPNCRCHVETILKTEQEMDADDAAIRSGGRPSTGSVNTVKDMPDQFERWLQDNEERIARANSLPYFLRDNYTITPGADGSLTFERIVSLTPAVPATKSLLDIAAERHAARTPQQVDAIKARAAARQEAAKAYDDLMAEYGHLASEIDFAQAAFTADYKAWKKEVDALRTQIDARFAAFGYIKDAKALSQTYTLAELESAEKAVSGTLSKLGYEYLPYADKVKKLDFEIAWVEDKKKFSTWKIAKQAYVDLKSDVVYKKKIADAKDKYVQFNSFKSNSNVLKSKVKELNDVLYNHDAPDLNKVDKLVDEIENRISSITRERNKKLLKNMKGSAFGEDAYSAERVNNALWDKTGGKKADDALRPIAEASWRSASEVERDMMYDYTTTYCHVNEPLQGRQYAYHQEHSRFFNKVNAMTQYIDDSKLPCDMWFQRGDSGIDVIGSRIKFNGGSVPSNIQDLVGMEMKEGGFLSAGSGKDKGFTDKPVILNIYAPKGCNAAYVEPFSYYGKGDKRSWDGVNAQSIFSQEDETIFQRGTVMKITKVEKSGGKIYIDCYIIRQEVDDVYKINRSLISY